MIVLAMNAGTIYFQRRSSDWMEKYMPDPLMTLLLQCIDLIPPFNRITTLVLISKEDTHYLLSHFHPTSSIILQLHQIGRCWLHHSLLVRLLLTSHGGIIADGIVPRVVFPLSITFMSFSSAAARIAKHQGLFEIVRVEDCRGFHFQTVRRYSLKSQ